MQWTFLNKYLNTNDIYMYNNCIISRIVRICTHLNNQLYDVCLQCSFVGCTERKRYKIKNVKYHTAKTDPKSNRKITKDAWSISLLQKIHDYLLSWFGIDTSIKSGGAKLVLGAKPYFQSFNFMVHYIYIYIDDAIYLNNGRFDELIFFYRINIQELETQPIEIHIEWETR